MDKAAKMALLARTSYVGSGHHKLRPGDYGFLPSPNPSPSKSPCDELRSVLLSEASDLFREGVLRGMVSEFPDGSIPKYVWAVDHDGEVYEAKTRPEHETVYHGYRVGDDERHVREYVLSEWRRRCP